MIISKILHDSATQYFDMAKIAKLKLGDIKIHDEYLNRAFLLEKEAALKMETNKEDSYWQYMLFRSAAWLAFQCKKYEEAFNLTKWGLSGNPPVYEKRLLDNLWFELSRHIPNMPSKPESSLHFNGILSSADIDNKKIKIRKNEFEDYLIIILTEDLIQNIGTYLGKTVVVSANKNEKGVLVAEQIKLAA